MTREIIDGIVTLTADDGAYITNGQTFSTKVLVGRLGNEYEWRDATAEQYEAWVNAEEISDSEALEIITGGATE